MAAARITDVRARQVLDSRGNPTVEAEVAAGDAVGRASVPSGASTGSREALELRDGDPSLYLGRSVLKAVDGVRRRIAPALAGLPASGAQRAVDDRMIELDGTPNKASLGANAVLAASLAAARLGARVAGKPLWRHLLEDLGAPNAAGGPVLPAPMMNIVNGGRHASNNLDVQEFMITPHLKASFSENLRAGVEIFHHLKSLLAADGHSTNVGDEGGFAPDLPGHGEAVEYILKAVRESGREPGRDVSIALDAAASEFCEDGVYRMQGRELDAGGMIDYYRGLLDEHPIHSIEDGLDEGDREGWRAMTRELGDRTLLVGDDLFVTNRAILEEGIKEGIANAILIKVNQIGTLSETFDAIALAQESGYAAIVSHRSGETDDAFIADLAVATGTGRIKTGSASRSDRLSKYNRLLRIEEALGDAAVFAPAR